MLLGSIFAGYVPLVPQEHLSHCSLFLVYFLANYRPHLSHFWVNDSINLKVPKKREPILATLLKMPEKATSL